MKSEDAIKKIDNLINVVAVDIPDTLEILGKKYNLRDDINSAEKERIIKKYEDLYMEVRERIKNMSDVPEDLVTKAIILRRVVLFLKDFRSESEIDEKKRWLQFIKKVSR